MTLENSEPTNSAPVPATSTQATFNLLKIVANSTDLKYSKVDLIDIEGALFRAVSREFTKLGIPEHARLEHLKSVLKRYEPSARQKLALPTKAPELYKKREKRKIDGVLRKEKPHEFIRRVYKKWLQMPGGLPRPIIRDIDEPCYRALYKHGSIPSDFETILPTAQGTAVEHLNRSAEDRVAALKDSQKRANAKRVTRQLSG